MRFRPLQAFFLFFFPLSFLSRVSIFSIRECAALFFGGFRIFYGLQKMTAQPQLKEQNPKR